MKWINPFAKKTPTSEIKEQIIRPRRDINEVVRNVDKQIGNAVTRLADT